MKYQRQTAELAEKRMILLSSVFFSSNILLRLLRYLLIEVLQMLHSFVGVFVHVLAMELIGVTVPIIGVLGRRAGYGAQNSAKGSSVARTVCARTGLGRLARCRIYRNLTCGFRFLFAMARRRGAAVPCVVDIYGRLGQARYRLDSTRYLVLVFSWFGNWVGTASVDGRSRMMLLRRWQLLFDWLLLFLLDWLLLDWLLLFLLNWLLLDWLLLLLLNLLLLDWLLQSLHCLFLYRGLVLFSLRLRRMLSLLLSLLVESLQVLRPFIGVIVNVLPVKLVVVPVPVVR